MHGRRQLQLDFGRTHMLFLRLDVGWGDHCLDHGAVFLKTSLSIKARTGVNVIPSLDIYTPDLRDILCSTDTVRLSECELIFRTSLNENREHRAHLYSSVHAGTQLRTTM